MAKKQRISQTDLKTIQRKLKASTGKFIPRDVLGFIMKKKGFKIGRK